MSEIFLSNSEVKVVIVWLIFSILKYLLIQPKEWPVKNFGQKVWPFRGGVKISIKRVPQG